MIRASRENSVCVTLPTPALSGSGPRVLLNGNWRCFRAPGHIELGYTIFLRFSSHAVHFFKYIGDFFGRRLSSEAYYDVKEQRHDK